MKTFAVKVMRTCGANASLRDKLASKIEYYYLELYDPATITVQDAPERYATYEEARAAADAMGHVSDSEIDTLKAA